MVDEGDVASRAVGATPTPEVTDALEEAPDAEAVANSAAKRPPRRRDAPPHPDVGSGVPQPPGAPQAPAPASPSAPDAPHDERERRLKAGSHQANICEPLWKVRRPSALRKSRLSLHLEVELARRCISPGLCRACPARTPLVAHPCPVAHSCLICLRARAVSQVLKPHQVEGVRWLFAAIHRGGGLLADDPGLGKTLQVITVVEALIRSDVFCRVLIVMPANLLANWDAVR